MMLIVVSNPVPTFNEGNLINALFNEGLALFHLRKPKATTTDIKSLLDKIKPTFLSRIALHQHHLVAADYGIRRLHFPESVRNAVAPDLWAQWKEKGMVMSTSIHEEDTYQSLPPEINYTFFGPVFNSISKEGYVTTLREGYQWPFKGSIIKAVAIGGINEATAINAYAMGFNGVAALGAVWQSVNPVMSFKKLQKVCSVQ